MPRELRAVTGLRNSASADRETLAKFTGDRRDAGGRTDPGNGHTSFPKDVLAKMQPMYLADHTGKLTLTNTEFDRIVWDEAPAVAVGPARTPQPLIGVFARLDSGEPEIQRRETVRIDGDIRRFRSVHFRTIGPDDRAAYAGIYTDVTRKGTADDTGYRDAEDITRRSQRELTVSVRELRERDMALHRALDEGRAASIAKTEFLGKMSHELRTPLNAVIGFAEMSLAEFHGPLPERYFDYLHSILSAAGHLRHVIDDILETANIEASKVDMDTRPVRLATVLAEAKSIVGARAAEKTIGVDALGADDHWQVLADPARLRQICVNVLGNAVKFTGPGGKIGVDVAARDDGALEIAFWDTGIGIPDDHHGRIFESFHQVTPDPLSQPTNGAGLGLTISYQLAQLMRGDIRVESTPGEGSRFILRLPSAPTSG